MNQLLFEPDYVKETMAPTTELLKDCFERARHENGGASSLTSKFYKRLFEKYPSLEPLFSKPPEIQEKMLISALVTIIEQAEQSDKRIPYFHALGIRHLMYETENAHYSALAENFLTVMREHLSIEGEWTNSMHEAWTAAIVLIVTGMIEASNNPEAFAEELLAHGFSPNGLPLDNCNL